MRVCMGQAESLRAQALQTVCRRSSPPHSAPCCITYIRPTNCYHVPSRSPPTVRLLNTRSETTISIRKSKKIEIRNFNPHRLPTLSAFPSNPPTTPMSCISFPHGIHTRLRCRYFANTQLSCSVSCWDRLNTCSGLLRYCHQLGVDDNLVGSCDRQHFTTYSTSQS